MLLRRPLISCAWPAPGSNDLTLRTELDNRGRSRFLIVAQGLGTVKNPDMVLRSKGSAAYRADEPFIRQWLRPRCIHFQYRRPAFGRLGRLACRLAAN